MAYTVKQIAISNLLLDQSNPRLRDEQPSQQATQLALASLVGEQLVNIAEDIVENGLDPTALPAVVPDSSNKRRFRVLEGNRRLLAIKALDTPGIIDSALTPARRKRFSDVARVYAENPISVISCVVFDSAEEAWYWIELRHTGENGGVGLVRWGSDEQDRFRSRHGRSAARKPAGQILDFVDSVDIPHEGANSKILSNLQRFISTPRVREELGIEIERGVVYSHYPADQVYKGLRKAVSDLRSNQIKVGQIYYEKDRLDYIGEFTAAELPDPATRLSVRVALTALSPNSVPTAGSGGTASGGRSSSGESTSEGAREPRTNGGSSSAGGQSGSGTGAPATGSGADIGGGGDSNSTADRGGTGGSPGVSRSRVRPRSERDFVIPRGVALFIPDARINVIHNELRTLSIEDYPNACAVLLRVFVELSVDSYITRESLMTETDRNNAPLAKRLKIAASGLKNAGQIEEQLEKAVIKVADGTGPFGTSTTTFNQYVHNRYVYPKPPELRAAWDELEPFMRQVWKR